MSPRVPVVLGLVGALVFAACEIPGDTRSGPSYTDDVAGILGARCVRCHAGFAPAGKWRADSYMGAVGCVASGEAAALAPLGGPASAAPLLRVLARPDHAALVSADELAVLTRWVSGGSALRAGSLHGDGYADPRSDRSHGRFLRARRYAPLVDANDADACGACHDGVGSRRGEIRVGAASAPACTTCHAEPDGPVACSTCHGSGARESAVVAAAGALGRSFPPRDPCFFPEDPHDRAHAAHASASPSLASGRPCSTCHPEPGSFALGGVHANGHVEVWFDHAVAGRLARYDGSNRRCAGTCHDHGGARPSPTWSDPPMTCGDCHLSPPSGHYRGACTSCHREADATGTSLANPVLHANGKVDLGDGSGRCGACHGRGDDPWPSTGAHRAHGAPRSSRPVACETCHVVPEDGDRHPVGRGAPEIRFAGLATRGGRRATYDPATKSCAGNYCHEGSGAKVTAPRWDSPPTAGCESCHGAPPPPPHSQATTCGGATCHEGLVTGLSMTAGGAAVHVNGAIDRPAP